MRIPQQQSAEIVGQILDILALNYTIYIIYLAYIGYKVLSFKPKSILDEVNYYFRITLKGKNSLFLTKVIFISVESSNLGIMLKNTTF